MVEWTIEEIIEEIGRRNVLIHSVSRDGLFLHAGELALSMYRWILEEISEREGIDWREVAKEALSGIDNIEKRKLDSIMC